MNKEKKEETKNTGAVTLLETGRKAFPGIISHIQSARQEIIIHMFIWREDGIGITIAEELLKAADRGVSIVIEKDRYGLLFEYAEESQRSFCHSPDLLEQFQIKIMCLGGSKELFRNHLQTQRSELYMKLKDHPNVMMRDDRTTKDHSKYYIFDRQVIILGGINIEDKEYLIDLKGRVYFDYMIKVTDKKIVSQFLEKREFPQKKHDLFRLNIKEPVRCFELKDSFLKLIDETENELTVMMAYFAPENEVLSAINRALKRGVSVRILIPGDANFMNNTNRFTVSKLMRNHNGKSDGKLSVYTTDYMLHAKLAMNEKHIIVGSCNITHKSFNKLGEMDIITDNDDSRFAHQVHESVNKVFEESRLIEDVDDISFNRFIAAIEIMIMR